MSARETQAQRNAIKPYLIPGYRVSLVREAEAINALGSNRWTQPADAAQGLRAYLGDDLDREHFVIALLTCRHTLIGINTVSVGCLTSSLVHPREVFKPAILASAAAIVLCHNHPSGDPEPSADDIALTRRLVSAGTLLGIEVLDHVVLGAAGRFVSLKTRGIV